ncbi:A disintegrin and metalloproteinase with thrombospondin motifs 7 [Tachyglossus aculeatus]|uniref:A disintegrin and metalloproteinase with thrombospondin motifs 7 n=1 Tax=Tachyglossus aculeatus TaxID=9261 RepID=UPI0018F50802|nr:A disintegrin and metalloproteinase with thrombospondin motifs 7 [Tachyglossus aculeatus]
MPPGFDIVHPIQVDAGGSFVSYDLSPRVLHKRDLSSRTSSSSYYELHYRGQDLRFNLSVNQGLLAPGFVRERRHGGLAQTRIQASLHGTCHLLGEVRTQQWRGGLAAISTCSGLKGVFRLSQEDYFIEPLDVREPEAGTALPHVIYKRQAPEHREDLRAHSSVGRENKPPDVLRTCGVEESQENLEKSEKRRERWEQKQQRKRRIRQRSISKEKWVETLVVADQKMVEYHGPEHIENYVLTVMNMVAGLFQDSSIGNPINIALVRLVLLEDDEVDLKISHHADNTLKSFCKWQKNINMKSDSHPQHHDVAVLLTRKDICAAMNKPCETLGLSHVSGMCQPHRSCNINEDTGLPLAFTVAHELGHSFGIQHDGSGNDCEPVGKRPFIMSPQLLYDTSPLTWSRCSREYVTRFLDRGWGLCLDDPPAKNVIDFPSVPPGVLYDVSHQCRLQYGAYSTFCDDMDNVCNTLWCSVGTTCHSKLDAAVDGTTCGENRWCFNGDCVHKGFRPEAIHGSWGAWSSWSVCSRSCGAGVQNAERQCNNPTPKYRGKYCVGERKRFRVCNIKACPSDRLSFRHTQCSQFNAMLYKGKLYKWVPVPNNVNPCELHCRPEGEYFAEKLRDAVVDGTPCYEGNTSRDVCINGICKNVGCDYEIDSNAVEDRCGVCHGDGSTCQTVKKTFEESEGLGYVDVGLIPAGAREIRIEEVAEAGNFLALRSEDPEKYFLNGGWTIQWNGDYKVAGTTFTYERTGNWENLTSPGPTREPVWIQLLFQESNPGVRYEYTIRREADSENEIQPPEFSWHYGSWTKCTATCGTGVQRQSVHCVEKLAGLVEEQYCDALSRPDDRQKKCSEEPCPARWWVAEWQKCSVTCGDAGLRKRTVLCIQSVGLDEQRALPPGDCHHLPKPDAQEPCPRNPPCPARWATGNWSECSVTCGNGMQRRPVYCSNDTGAPCSTAQRPESETACSLPQCLHSDWSGSGSSSKELFNEIHYIPGNHFPKFPPLGAGGAPRANDLNLIGEDDFASPGGKKGNVFVDDFYYDYNFINFHEDLSYAPLGVETGQAGVSPPAPSARNGSGSEVTGRPTSGPLETTQEADEEGAEVFSEVFPSPQPGPAHGSADSPTHFPTTNPLTALPPRRPTTSPPTEPRDPNSSDIPNQAGRGEPHPVGSEGEPKGEKNGPPRATDQGEGDASGLHHSIGGSQEEEEEEADTQPRLGETADAPGDKDPMGPGPEGQKPPAGPRGHGSATLLPPRLQGALPEDLAPLLPTPGLEKPSPEGITQVPGDAVHFLYPSHQAPTGSSASPGGTQVPGHSSPATTETVPGADGQMFLPHPSIPPLGPAAPRPSKPLLSPGPTPRGGWTPTTTSLWDSPASPADVPIRSSAPDHELTPRPGKELDSREPEVGFHPNSSRVPETTSPGTLAQRTGYFPTTLQPSTLPHHPGSRRPPSGTILPGTTPLHAVVPAAASWEVGNWSECSTTCGLGGIWRTVRCSSGREEDCVLANKPVPARRCYLRPCASWSVGNWSKCSKNCGGGSKVRDVHCADLRDQRLLRPFHCQPLLGKPPAQLPCHVDPCLDWYMSSWRECSEACGGGEQQRLVTCPQFGKCDELLRPNTTRPCNTHPCTKWVVGSWGPCTAPCGGGIQRRLVKCVNTKTGHPEEDSSLCDHEAWPENSQKCNPQDCDLGESGSICDRDRLTFSFCETLRLLGRCLLPTVRVQCCRTCRLHGSGPRERGDERASRR